MNNILGKRIELERTRLGLNQIELAKKLNLSSSSSISQYEKGDRIPSDDIKLKMAEIFNCTLDYLLGKTDIRNPAKVNLDEMDIAFASGIKGLNKENQETLKNIMEGLLAKQKIENEKGEKK